jgi:hypothetical protein
LDEGADKCFDLFDARSFAQSSESLFAWPSGTHLQVHPQHLLMQGAPTHLFSFGDPRDGSIEA